jgi:hypothetical protein
LNVAQQRLHKLTDIIPQTRILNCHRTVVLELWICPSFRSLAETGSKPSPDLATKLLPFSPLIAQKTLLVDLDGLQVSTWVAPIVGLYHRFGHKGASSRGEGLAKTWGYTGL